MLQIKKRDGSLVSFNPSKIYNRIKKASKGLKVNDAEIFIKVITSVPTEGVVSTKELDKLVAEISSAYTATHYDYSVSPVVHYCSRLRLAGCCPELSSIGANLWFVIRRQFCLDDH